MASENQVVSLPKIVKGPGRIDLLEALFFNRESILMFDLDKKFDGQSQLFVKLLGMIPCGVEQAKVLIIDYFKDQPSAERGMKTRAVIVYDDHIRTGRFTQSNTVDELLKESWYTS
jgi:hypothetical protein